MIQPGDHISDLILSAGIDEQLTLDEARQMHAHLETCSVCRSRLDELRSVVGLLRMLPELEAPRDFALGPRLVADPPNVVRLRRWYGFARAGAASLAAVFVFLSVGAFYLDAQPGRSTAGLSAESQFASAPAPAENVAPQPPQSGAAAKSAPAAPQVAPTAPAVRDVAPAAPPAAGAAAPPAAQSAPAAAAAARPAAAPVASPAAALSARSQAAPAATGAEVADQVSAATSVRPLPTAVPTLAPVPTRAPPQVALQPVTATRAELGAPLRTAAASVGLLAVVGLLATLLIRHRLRAATTTPPTE